MGVAGATRAPLIAGCGTDAEFGMPPNGNMLLFQNCIPQREAADIMAAEAAAAAAAGRGGER